ncbi:C/D box methylation guide ribonucleoprotein complex aNOP56 subunit [Candidatus Bathyarchaeota archaeon]|nr:C/D box methylation guide ribonucleoprotein complex aNOP56 subunit [Candidatus Bathyarchaeota archaeon]
MKTATVIACSFGIIAFNEEKKLIDKVLFPRKPRLAAKTLVKIEGGKFDDEVAELIKRLMKGSYDKFVFENASLANEVREKFGVNVEFSRLSAAGEMLRSNMERFAVETGFVKDAEGFSLWTHNVTLEMAKLRVKGAVEKRDLVVAQVIQTLDDLDKTINLFMGRVREWYGIHFPELDRLLEKHETYARLVLNLGDKENFAPEKLVKEEIPAAKAEQIAKIAEASMGADLSETDLERIQTLCKNILNLYQLRQALENYLDKTMEEVAPNTKALVGSLLGARLIALAGGLMNLARRPASTIQVLGAEKALFRSLKTGTRPPKHGIIFQHTYLHEAKRWHRGKIARALAGKVSIAARIDAFGGKYLGDELKADLEKRMEEIREKYAEAPPISEKKPKPRHEKRRNRWRRADKG